MARQGGQPDPVRPVRRSVGSPLVLFAVGLALSLSARAQKPAPAALERTFSTSQQIVVYGSTRAARSALVREAEALRSTLYSTTGLSEEWKWPIVINLDTPPFRGSVTPRSTIYVGDGNTLKVQVDVPLSSARTESELQSELLRAMLLEIAYREAVPQPKKAYTNPPDWLVEGLWQEHAFRTNGISSSLFERLVQSGPPPKLDAFLRQRPETLDPTSLAIYRAQAMTLLRALLATKDGGASLSKYLAGLHAVRSEDPQPLLAAFPEVAEDPASLVKLWTLSIARASAADRIEMYSLAETEGQLSLILDDLRPPANPKKPELEAVTGPLAMPLISKEATGRFILRRKAEELLNLEARAHPLYRPVVEEYRIVTSDLAVKPRRDAEKRLTAVGELRAALNARSEAMTDYLNWFEATKLDTPSEAFSETLGKVPETTVPKRTDAISLTLDAIEKSTGQ